MSDQDKQELESSLSGYKQKVIPVTKATLTWEKDLIFTGRTQEGYEIEYDAHVQWGCKPTDSLLLSLAGCMGIDTVMFLQKMKVRIAEFRMNLVGERNPEPPQYFRKIEMKLFLAGKDLDPKKVDRAVALSHEKYCSVYHSLRKDMEIVVTYTLEDREPAPKAEE